jgi:hypothetical protein
MYFLHSNLLHTSNCHILTLWFSILLRVYYKSSLTSTVRNFSLIYLFIYFIFIFNLNHTTGWAETCRVVEIKNKNKINK